MSPTSSSRRELLRYKPFDRMLHWLVAVGFILAGLSGLAFFHPSFFFLTNLFGGGGWTRILHPFVGVVMFAFFLVLVLRFLRDNLPAAADAQWFSQLGAIVGNRERPSADVGKYNGGQKLVFWVMVLSLLALVVTGVVLWRPYFAPQFTVDILRLAVVVHAVSAFVALLAAVVHVYAAIWVKGTVRAMTRGTVSHKWAAHHHPAWYRKVTGSRT
ncbi:MAG: formate dehydrogenase subunit gamma [Ectothiorhodospiraceae bacterium]|nr:formate dehydrogenase subunit gamma [Ectothiorhodospiraceae bacterium]